MTTAILNPRRLATLGVVTNLLQENISCNSIDLRTHRVYEIRGHLDLTQEERILPEFVEVEFDDILELEPHKTYQIEFYEKVHLTSSLCAISILRSTLFKSGASGEVGLYDSGYSGSTGMTVTPSIPLYVRRGTSIAQLLVFSCDSNKVYDGFYKNDNWR